jgi:hypothetical protein
MFTSSMEAGGFYAGRVVASNERALHEGGCAATDFLKEFGTDLCSVNKALILPSSWRKGRNAVAQGEFLSATARKRRREVDWTSAAAAST